MQADNHWLPPPGCRKTTWWFSPSYQQKPLCVLILESCGWCRVYINYRARCSCRLQVTEKAGTLGLKYILFAHQNCSGADKSPEIILLVCQEFIARNRREIPEENICHWILFFPYTAKSSLTQMQDCADLSIWLSPWLSPTLWSHYDVSSSKHFAMEELFWSAPFTCSTVSLKAFLPWQTVWHQIWLHSYHIS